MKRDEKQIRHNFTKYLEMAVLTLLILFSSTASAVTIDGTQISSRHACNPDIYNDKVVWQETHSTGMDDYYFIYMYDLSTSQKTQITRDILEPYQFDPAIYEDKIVWKDFRNGNYNIYMYDLSTFQETQITTSGQANSPDIYGDKIVWVNSAYGLGDICVYDLSANYETCITTSGLALDPAIDGDRIVWEDRRDGNYNIYMYDLSTSLETQISTSGSAHAPAIYDDKIVWEDTRSGKSNIYMFDLSTSLETQVSTSTPMSTPAIHGDKIVWAVDIEPFTGGFCIYHLSTSQETLINTNNQVAKPTIYGDWLVWQDAPDVNSEGIWFCTVSEGEMEPIIPTANFSASILTGKVPLTVTFTDQSTGLPTSWYWKFGDKNTSTAQNPVNTYKKAGKYTVRLTVENAAGSDTRKISKYIIVKKK